VTARRPVAFLDRDGTIVHDAHYLADPDGVALIDGAADAIARLRERGVAVVIVTNQSGIARGLITRPQYESVAARVAAALAAAGAAVDATYVCPHHPDVDGPCDCRKPGPALYAQAIAELDLDRGRTAFVGDRWSDIAAADTFDGLAVLVPSPDTPPDDVARARTAGMLARSLGEAVDRIVAELT
jgi:histidinol-phosphate phosphatase family protein